jgi:DtxR family Mn-dependent transcriptional regulator
VSELTANNPLSSSVGDYVKAIWEATGTGSASTNEIAARLSVASASVTNMLVRLQERGLVEYERYRGASLTEVGHAEALRLVRRHRLIETFLTEHLGYSWEEVTRRRNAWSTSSPMGSRIAWRSFWGIRAATPTAPLSRQRMAP